MGAQTLMFSSVHMSLRKTACLRNHAPHKALSEMKHVNAINRQLTRQNPVSHKLKLRKKKSKIAQVQQ